jgi:thiaminase/transcriptional activator TenA
MTAAMTVQGSGFSQAAWDACLGVRQAIHALPFNRELAAGTLPRPVFRHYMIQDAIYLVAYARTLALAAAKAPSAAEQEFWAEASKTALIVERALHGDYLAKFDIPLDAIAKAEPSPACQAYTSYLLSAGATADYAELTAAILPCFWIYWDVGTAIVGTAAKPNFYQAWIDTYADAGFGAQVQKARAILDEAASRLAPSAHERLHLAFRRCCQYEWLFWDSAYRLERWPV